jgi:hypothetical protein
LEFLLIFRKPFLSLLDLYSQWFVLYKNDVYL